MLAGAVLRGELPNMISTRPSAQRVERSAGYASFGKRVQALTIARVHINGGGAGIEGAGKVSARRAGKLFLLKLGSLPTHKRWRSAVVHSIWLKLSYFAYIEHEYVGVWRCGVFPLHLK